MVSMSPQAFLDLSGRSDLGLILVCSLMPKAASTSRRYSSREALHSAMWPIPCKQQGTNLWIPSTKQKNQRDLITPPIAFAKSLQLRRVEIVGVKEKVFRCGVTFQVLIGPSRPRDEHP